MYTYRRKNEIIKIEKKTTIEKIEKFLSKKFSEKDRDERKFLLREQKCFLQKITRCLDNLGQYDEDNDFVSIKKHYGSVILKDR